MNFLDCLQFCYNLGICFFQTLDMNAIVITQGIHGPYTKYRHRNEVQCKNAAQVLKQ